MEKLKLMQSVISHSEDSPSKSSKLRVIKGKYNPERNHEDMLLWKEFTQKGCESSFAMLYQKYFIELYRYGSKLFQEKELVKDCIHDLYVDLWKKRKELKPVNNIRHYLLVALKRRLINQYHRSKKITFQDTFEDRYCLFSLSREHEIIDLQTLKAKKERIINALNLLTERQQKVLRLKFYNNFTNQEIADKLSIDITSTYNLVSKALKGLRNNLTS